jgi:ferritin-like metal-binding protein YciE
MSSLSATSIRRGIFLEHLNTVCSSKHHLLSILPELKGFATNKTLIQAIEDYCEDNEKQIDDLARIYTLMEETYTEKKILGMRVIAFEAYKAAIGTTEITLERDCAILLYLGIIDSIEVQYFKTLMNLCRGLDIEFVDIQPSYFTAVDNLILINKLQLELVA